MRDLKNKIVCVMGPTATGKTDLAMRLYDQIPCDLVSVDSALVYRGMDVGTAKPTFDELKQYPHHLIDICEPTQAYSAGDFCQDALREIEAVVAKNRMPVLVGGTMMYFNQLLHRMAKLPKADLDVRDRLLKKSEEIGWAAMHDDLKKIDPSVADYL